MLLRSTVRHHRACSVVPKVISNLITCYILPAKIPRRCRGARQGSKSGVELVLKRLSPCHSVSSVPTEQVLDRAGRIHENARHGEQCRGGAPTNPPFGTIDR